MPFFLPQTRPLAMLPVTAILLLSRSLLAQNPDNAPTAKPHHPVETSVSVSVIGQLTATRISDSRSRYISESLQPSAGVFGTFRQSFTPWLGYSVNFGYTRTPFRYTAATPLDGSSFGLTSLPSNVYETSVSYIAQKRVSTHMVLFGEAGAGSVAFAENDGKNALEGYPYVNPERSNTFRPTGIAGIGIDYRLQHGLALRAEYRGLFLPFPDYASGIIGLKTLTSEPAVGLTYTFGEPRAR